MLDCLLVLCPQNSFLSPTGTMYQGDKAETLKIRMKDYLKGFRNPKVFIREKRSINDPFYKADKTFNIATTGDYQVPDDLRPLADFFHDKTRYNALYLSLIHI